MHSDEAERHLDARLKSHSPRTVARAWDAMRAFYREERALDVEIEADGDMLLFEWGTYGFGAPPTFQVSFTRQFLRPGEDEPLQLRLVLHFPPAVGRTLGAAHRWCPRPSQLDDFASFVEGSGPFESLSTTEPLRVDCRMETV